MPPGKSWLWRRARGGGSSDPCTPGGVELVMSPGLALCEAGSQESSAGGFRRAELARREPGWTASRWARITQAGPGPHRPGRRDVHFALERALLTAHLDGEMHLSRAECTSRRAQDRPAPTTPNGFRPRRPAPTPAHGPRPPVRRARDVRGDVERGAVRHGLLESPPGVFERVRRGRPLHRRAPRGTAHLHRVGADPAGAGRAHLAQCEPR